MNHWYTKSSAKVSTPAGFPGPSQGWGAGAAGISPYRERSASEKL
ncbi:hypothetical protein [Kamptonema formosum]|nr:hypothetical protein [Oscillatoria sp. PCC 10802]